MKRRKRKVKEPYVPMSRVNRCSWDGTLDYEIPTVRVRELLAEGKLFVDVTNNMYTSQTDEQCKRRMPGVRIT